VLRKKVIHNVMEPISKVFILLIKEIPTKVCKSSLGRENHLKRFYSLKYIYIIYLCDNIECKMNKG
jgi:hypothetical protein